MPRDDPPDNESTLTPTPEPSHDRCDDSDVVPPEIVTADIPLSAPFTFDGNIPLSPPRSISDDFDWTTTDPPNDDDDDSD